MGIIYAEQVEYMSVDAMQQTHEDEIALINDIFKSSIAYERHEITHEALKTKVETYCEHVKQHFADEEALMLRYGFASYEMHKMAHDMFLADMEYAQLQSSRSNDLQKILNFIQKTPEWVVMHVNSVDAPTAHYIALKMQQEASAKG